MFSLGSTLSAALGYDVDPEMELGVDICRLLEHMQEEKPGDRPSPKVWKIHNRFHILPCILLGYILLNILFNIIYYKHHKKHIGHNTAPVCIRKTFEHSQITDVQYIGNTLDVMNH